jgi:hypothetical protein
MADFTVVPANILPSGGAALQIGTAGAVIAQGDTLSGPDRFDMEARRRERREPGLQSPGIAQSAAPSIGQPVIVLTQ